MKSVNQTVAKALGYAIPHKAITDHCKGVLKWNILTIGGNQGTGDFKSVDFTVLKPFGLTIDYQAFPQKREAWHTFSMLKVLIIKFYFYGKIRKTPKAEGLNQQARF